MATVPVTRTWVAGEVVTAAYMNNNITAVLGWLLAPALLRCRQIVSQSCANGAVTPLTFTAEDVDTTGMHSTSVNTSRATAVYPGWYRTGGGGTIAGNATGQRVLEWIVNGGFPPGASSSWQGWSAAVNRGVAKSVLMYLNVGDYLELTMNQNSGGALSTAVSGGEQSSMDLTWESN